MQQHLDQIMQVASQKSLAIATTMSWTGLASTFVFDPTWVVAIAQLMLGIAALGTLIFSVVKYIRAEKKP